MEATYFTILWWFLPYIHMNQPWVYMCSPSWTPLQPLSLSHPWGSSQCTNPEHPVLWIEPRLAIYFTYDNIHVSMLFSQIVPPLPSPTESKIIKKENNQGGLGTRTDIYTSEEQKNKYKTKSKDPWSINLWWRRQVDTMEKRQSLWQMVLGTQDNHRKINEARNSLQP